MTDIEFRGFTRDNGRGWPMILLGSDAPLDPWPLLDLRWDAVGHTMDDCHTIMVLINNGDIVYENKRYADAALNYLERMIRREGWTVKISYDAGETVQHEVEFDPERVTRLREVKQTLEENINHDTPNREA